MIQSLLKLSAVSMLVIAVAGVPCQVLAQPKEKPAVEKKASEAPREATIPFRGKVTALDQTAKTITVGARTFQVTSETKIVKAGKPATLGDGVVGEEIGGAYKKANDGKLIATSVRFGVKPDPTAEKAEKAEARSKKEK